MNKPDSHDISPDPIYAECIEGYNDGRRPDSPEPGPNRHPAYVHGFLNGRDDLANRPRNTAQKIIDDWDYIVATCGGVA